MIEGRITDILKGLRFDGPIEAGTAFGRWVVIRPGKTVRSRRHYWVRCVCGNEREVQESNLRTFTSLSCGCFNHETMSRLRTKPNNGAAIKIISIQYRRGARERGYPYELSNADVRGLICRPCHYCGGGFHSLTQGLRHNGIDRVNNALGYVLGNVVPCCKLCNRAKGTMTVSDFVSLVRAIAANQNLDQDKAA